MNLRGIRRITALFAAFALLACAGVVRAQSTAEGSFARTLKVTGTVDLDVKTGSGSINLRTGAAGSVQISAKIKARDTWSGGLSAQEKVRRLEAHPPIEQSGNIIVIGKIEDRDLQNNVSISYELVVPADTKLRSHTGSGSIDASGVRGPVEAGTGSGEVTLSSIAGEVRVSTGSGGIHLNSIQGLVRANTGSGSIRARGVGGAFNGSTGSGEIEVQQSAEGDVDAETGSGTITISGVRGGVRARTGSGSIRADGEMKGNWRLHTSSGSVTVRLPQGAAFDLAARTSSGSIQTAHPITVQGTIGRRELNGKVRGGGPLLDVNTSSGSIHIE
ncbi:MAG: DUF4097 domain-containing protein [Acidobacteria bacterium]|nr:DUF4097 domain-containing protein [Acidobacteriota bacterium]MCL5286978.1 DUF4097 domain-containing protein [Acidobacteriota bacterium]